MSAATAPTATVSQPIAILLLGWIGAIKATGASLTTVALAQATADLGFDSSTVALASSIGTLAVAATVIGTGLAADRIGRRRVLMASFVVTAFGSLLSLIAWAAVPYIVGLVVAGVGFGAMFAGSYAYVKAVAPGAKLGWALGLFGAYCSLLAAAASIAAGGLSTWSWRGLFAVVPLMCLLAWFATPRLLPTMPKVVGGSIDWLGLVLLGAAMVCVLTGISRMVGSVGVVGAGLLVVGLLLIAGWVAVELRSPEPSFPIRLFTSGTFVGAVVVGVTFNLIQAASSLQLSDYWQYLGRWSTFQVTMGIQPFYVIGVIGALVAGRLLTRGTSARAVITVSCLLTGVGFLALAPVRPDADYWHFLPAIVLIGTGMMAGTTAQSQVFVQQAPADTYGSVTASKTTVGQIGFALGFALSSVLADRLTFNGALTRLEAAGVPEITARHSLTGAASHLHVGVAPSTPAGQQLAAAAATSFQHAFLVTMLVCAGIMAVSAVLAWWLMRPRHPEDPAAVAAGSSG